MIQLHYLLMVAFMSLKYTLSNNSIQKTCKHINALAIRMNLFYLYHGRAHYFLLHKITDSENNRPSISPVTYVTSATYPLSDLG